MTDSDRIRSLEDRLRSTRRLVMLMLLVACGLPFCLAAADQKSDGEACFGPFKVYDNTDKKGLGGDPVTSLLADGNVILHKGDLFFGLAPGKGGVGLRNDLVRISAVESGIVKYNLPGAPVGGAGPFPQHLVKYKPQFSGKPVLHVGLTSFQVEGIPDGSQTPTTPPLASVHLVVRNEGPASFEVEISTTGSNKLWSAEFSYIAIGRR
jgi:hypothetical protein